MPTPGLNVRPATEEDLNDVEDMLNDFVKGHPAEKHARARSALREAYFGDSPVARLVVAVRDDRVIGMGQWTRMYDLFWSMYGGDIEWLYVRPDSRGSGVVAAIVAEICAEVREAGGEFIHGGGAGVAGHLYERIAIGYPTRECHVSAEAFQVLGDLAGSSLRDIVRKLPRPELNQVPPRARHR